MAGKPIGQLNGMWALLLKVNLTVVPMVLTGVLTWAIWITNDTFVGREWRANGNHFTQQDGRQLEERAASQRKVLESRLHDLDVKSAEIITTLRRIERDMDSPIARK
jgi:hypothetical protein